MKIKSNKSRMEEYMDPMEKIREQELAGLMAIMVCWKGQLVGKCRRRELIY